MYEAVDLRLERTVALKVMHPALADDDSSCALHPRGTLRGPAVARQRRAVYDQGADNGTVYLAMEYVQGRTLATCSAGVATSIRVPR